jgi:DNA-binding transcriptional regulator YdaS (Cro superfamily)
MEQKPRWAEMCAQILKQCETVRGGRESLAAFLGVHPTQVAIWLSGKSGPPRAVFEKAMEIILAEHDRREALEQSGPMPRRRRTDSA